MILAGCSKRVEKFSRNPSLINSRFAPADKPEVRRYSPSPGMNGTKFSSYRAIHLAASSRFVPLQLTVTACAAVENTSAAVMHILFFMSSVDRRGLSRSEAYTTGCMVFRVRCNIESGSRREQIVIHHKIVRLAENTCKLSALKSAVDAVLREVNKLPPGDATSRPPGNGAK